VRRRHGAGKSLAAATSLTYLQLAERNLGELENAEQHAREALALMIELFGAEHANSATALNNLAGVLRERGDLVSAEALYRESLLLRSRRLGENHVDLAGSYNNLAALLRSQGSWREAEELYRRSLDIAIEGLGPEHQNVGTAHRNLAITLHALGRHEEAQASLEQCLLIDTIREDPVAEATTHQVRAELSIEDGEGVAALTSSEAALTLRRELLLPGHPSVGRSLLAVARATQMTKDAASALIIAREASQVLKDLGRSHPDYLDSLVFQAELLIELERFESAAELLRSILQDYEDSRLRTAAARARATVDLASPYPALARALAASGDAMAAWNALEHQNGRSLAELRQLTGAELPPQLLRRRKTGLRDLRRLESELDTLLSSAASDSLLAARRDALRVAETTWSQLNSELKGQEASERRDLPSLDAVKDRLGESGALVMWVGEWGCLLVAGRDPVWRRCSPADAASQRLRAELAAVADAPAFAPPEQTKEFLHSALTVWQARIAPFSAELEGKRELFVIPSGDILGLPVECLLDDEGNLLLDKYTIHYVPSSALLIENAKRPRAKDNSQALFIGDPPFSGSASLPRLVHSEAELRASAAEFSGSTLLLGADASEQRLRELAERGDLAEFRVIHFATHAMSDDVEPARSGLILARDGLQDPVEALLSGHPIDDGILSAAEIAANWELSAGLVTLSACQTALGRRADGEGYLGLAHSFFEAGAQALVASLWSVDDEATALFMGHFYTQLQGDDADPAEALRAAKLWLRSHESGLYSHPYFWAAFVLIGA
jgi:CHAT domain-containing protein/tetratricopeptide (TPR) repeat protein